MTLHCMYEGMLAVVSISDVEDSLIPFWATRGKRTMHEDDEDAANFENDARQKRSTHLGHRRLPHRRTHATSSNMTDRTNLSTVRNTHTDETI